MTFRPTPMNFKGSLGFLLLVVLIHAHAALADHPGSITLAGSENVDSDLPTTPGVYESYNGGWDGGLSASQLSIPDLFGTSSGFAADIPFDDGGQGASSTDPLGHTWLFQQDSWGIPGPGFGIVSWLGNDDLVGFQITFELPSGTEILVDDFATPLEIAEGCCTSFVVAAGDLGNPNANWNVEVMNGNTVLFEPIGTDTLLPPGQFFFTHVFFTNNNVGAGVPFSAEYLVPEPGSDALGISALVSVALLAARKRRRRDVFG